MNSNDLFRKLITGTKFDLKKFEKDAKKFMVFLNIFSFDFNI